MGSLRNDAPDSHPVPKNAQKEANIYEDEINLIDYLRVLWKRKYFVLPGSVLPVLIVGPILFFLPRNYKVTYVYDVRDWSVYDVRDQSTYDVRDRSVYDVRDQSTYDVRDQSTYDVRDLSVYDLSNWNLDEKNYNVLLDRFYSAENIDKIVNKLRESGLDSHAELISRAGARKDLKKFVDYEVWPPYTGLSEVEITEPSELEQIRRLKALLLNMTIIGRPKKDISKISLVIRDNFENVIPVYIAQERLGSATRQVRAKLADIEANRFNLELSLKTNRAVLAKLRNIKTPVSERDVSNISLQFDIGGKTEYLPVQYQIQAAESKTTQVEGQISVNEERYVYYKDLLALNEKLLAQLKSNTPNYYTIQQFHSFLTDLVDSYKSKNLKGYLNSYIKKVENRISASAPVTRRPNVSAIARGTVKKSAIVFVISLMILMFIAFLLEGIQKSQAQTSQKLY
jgi:hypothetical protein